MKIRDINLGNMLEYHPQQGKVMLGSDRMLIMRQQALRVLRGLMYNQLGGDLSRSLLAQFGFQCGAGDYTTLVNMYEWETDADKLASGPVLHTWEGIVHANPTVIEYDRETGHFDMQGEWTNSYEAEIHLQLFGPSDAPVCHSLTGYASGWATVFFGRPCIAIETSCVGKGDDMCRFELREAERWGPEANPWKDALASTDVSLVRELEIQLALINEQQTTLEELNRRQRDAISQLSTPIMEVWDDVLVLPIVGEIDTQRGLDIMEQLLEAIARGQARCVIIDITGVGVVDAKIADYLLEVVRAAGLLGTYCVVTGVGADVAKTLVSIGTDLSSVTTLRNLKQGLRACMRFMAESS